MKVFVVMAVHNRKQYTLQCLSLLGRQNFNGFQIILIDDGSTDGTSSDVRLFYPQVIVIKGSGDWWWTRSMNEGFKYAVDKGADIIISMNNDTFFDDKLIESLISINQQYPYSIIGCLNTVKKKNEYLFFSGVKKMIWWKAKEIKYHKPFQLLRDELKGIYPTFCLNGRGTLIPASIFNTIGFFDEKRFPQYASDYDFCLRANKDSIPVYISWDIRVRSVIETTGPGRSFISQTWMEYFKSVSNRYSSNSIRMIWNYYSKHGGMAMISGFIIHYLRMFYSFYRKRNSLEDLK